MEVSVAEISTRHFEKAAVWEYFDEPGSGEVMVRDVPTIPINDLYGRVIAVRGQLACGKSAWLALAGLDHDPIHCRITRQVYLYDDHGSKLKISGQEGDVEDVIRRIEVFTGLAIGEVFPIAYDLAGVVDAADTIGAVLIEDAMADRDPVASAKLAALAAVRPGRGGGA